MTLVKRILKSIKRSMLKTDMERFLDQSQNVADLEDRIKRWNNKQHKSLDSYSHIGRHY